MFAISNGRYRLMAALQIKHILPPNPTHANPSTLQIFNIVHIPALPPSRNAPAQRTLDVCPHQSIPRFISRRSLLSQVRNEALSKTDCEIELVFLLRGFQTLGEGSSAVRDRDEISVKAIVLTSKRERGAEVL